MVNNMYSIETKKLTKKFKDKIAVNGIDLIKKNFQELKGKNIIVYATGSNPGRAEEMNKVWEATFTEEQVKKQEKLDAEQDEYDAIFNSADSVISALDTGKMELTDDNLVKISRLEGELQYRRNCLYSYIGLIKDPERSKQLLAEYKQIDSQLIALNKAKRKNKVK